MDLKCEYSVMISPCSLEDFKIQDDPSAFVQPGSGAETLIQPKRG